MDQVATGSTEPRLSTAGRPRLKIAFVMQSRFHLFYLAEECAKLGHDVTLFINYPKSICRKYGAKSVKIVTNLIHGVWFRLFRQFPFVSTRLKADEWHNRSFGVWASKMVVKHGPFDAVACMSSVAMELFRVLPSKTVKLLHRGSTHIRVQHEILRLENERLKQSFKLPEEKVMLREEVEYQLADQINVVSEISAQSFHGKVDQQKPINVLIPGVDRNMFPADSEIILQRVERWKGQQKLRVLYVGNMDARKGVGLWNQFLDSPVGQLVDVRFVGEVSPAAMQVLHKHRDRIEFCSRIPQYELKKHYEWADLFMILSLEEGFPSVVNQALSCCVPVLATTNSGVATVLKNGMNGWTVPVNHLEELVARMADIQTNRARYSHMIEAMRQTDIVTWQKTALHFLEIVQLGMDTKVKS